MRRAYAARTTSHGQILAGRYRPVALPQAVTRADPTIRERISGAA